MRFSSSHGKAFCDSALTIVLSVMCCCLTFFIIFSVCQVMKP
jgi:hypothetical protein